MSLQGEIGKLHTRIKALEDKLDSSDETSDEDSGDEILQALFRHGFVLKPRARRASASRVPPPPNCARMRSCAAMFKHST